MKVHLKGYPCNKGVSPKKEPYTVNKSDVTCEACLKPIKVVAEPKPTPKETKSKPKKQ